MPFFNIVAASNESTVVTEYEPVKSRSDSYQSEAELENMTDGIMRKRLKEI